MALIGALKGSSGGGSIPQAESITVAVGITEQQIQLPHVPVSTITMENTSTNIGTKPYGTSVYDVVNEDFILPCMAGAYVTYSVSGDVLTFQGSGQTGNWTYKITVI